MELNMVTIVNGIVVIGICLFMLSGWRNGFLWKLLSILGFFLVGVLAWWLSSPLSSMISLYPSKRLEAAGELLYGSFNRLLWFFVLFLVLNLAVLLLKPIARFMQHVPLISIVNRIGGVVLGFGQGVLLMTVCYFLLQLFFWSDAPKIAQQSLLRYGEPLCETMLFYVKEPLRELESFQEGWEEGKLEEAAQQIEDWLGNKE